MSSMLSRRKAPKPDPIDQTMAQVQEGVNAILSEAGDGLHVVQAFTEGMEPVSLLFGRKGEYVYATSPVNEFTLRVHMRVHIIKQCVIILDTFRYLNGSSPSIEMLESAGEPTEVHGWLFTNEEFFPLTAQQTFAFCFAGVDIPKDSMYKKPSSEVTEEEAGKTVQYKDAW